MSRITHQRLKPTNGRPAALTACGLPDVGIWTAAKRKLVTCQCCRNAPKE